MSDFDKNCILNDYCLNFDCGLVVLAAYSHIDRWIFSDELATFLFNSSLNRQMVGSSKLLVVM